MLALIIACAGGNGGGEACTIFLSPTTEHSDAPTSEGQKSGATQLPPKIDITQEVGSAQIYTRGQTPAASPQGALTPEAESQPLAGSTPTGRPAVATESPIGPVVTLGGVLFRVELAITSQERVQGLSGHPPIAPDEGMLFIYERAGWPSFWMKEMLFPLDMIWIDAECTVVHITRDAPPQAPEQALADLPRYGPTVPVQYVLEINAGEAESAAATVGSTVRFTGNLAGRYGC